MSPPEQLSDRDAEELLRLIAVAVTEYGNAADMTLSEFAEDLAMSMDTTTDRADDYRRTIEGALVPRPS